MRPPRDLRTCLSFIFVLLSLMLSDVPDVDAYSLELKKKILEAFEVFDHESNQTVDVRYGCGH